MTLAARDHRDLHPRGADRYTRPTFTGYPETGDEVKVVYRSMRSGTLKERVGTVEDVRDEGHYGGGTTHPAYLELTIDDGSEQDLRVWGGGTYGPSDADTEGEAPAQVYRRGLVDKPQGAGSCWRTMGLGCLVALYAPAGITFEVTVRNVPIDSLDDLGQTLESAVSQRFRNDSTGEDLLDVDVERTGRLDREK